METTANRSQPDDLVYIDLDEPTQWWATLIGIVAIALIAAVLIGPWLIDTGSDHPESLANTALQNTGSVCRPDASGVSNLLDPAVASWSRFCEWFIAPGGSGQD